MESHTCSDDAYEAMVAFTQAYQDELCNELSKLDGSVFREDAWEREPRGHGGGRTRVLAGGNLFEQAGVNWSGVSGATLPPSILAKYPQLKGKGFRATGTSMVLHPRNPHVPTVHLNYRYFEAGDGENKVWWCGGGMDLTPYYHYTEDCVAFHQELKHACRKAVSHIDGLSEEEKDRYGTGYHTVFKNWADAYFFNKHRREYRGIGGVFFDYLDSDTANSLYRAEPTSVEYNTDVADLAKKQPQPPLRPFHDVFAIVKALANAFLPAYTGIVQRRRDIPYTDDQRQWQLYRRGRYVEFNLVYDRGTIFGLQTGGRVESILMSLPPLVRFEYDYAPAEGTPEHEQWMINCNARDWV